MKYLIIIAIFLIPMTASTQLSPDSDLFRELQKQDSTLFERGYNQCDVVNLKKHISDDLRFYHDQGGITDKKAFLENTEKYLCSNPDSKPIRKLVANSLEVFPLYNGNGVIYGAIQNGVHNFYLRSEGKEDEWTSIAKFTHVWILENEIWKLQEVLSYDHQDTRK